MPMDLLLDGDERYRRYGLPVGDSFIGSPDPILDACWQYVLEKAAIPDGPMRRPRRPGRVPCHPSAEDPWNPSRRILGRASREKRPYG